MSSVLKRVDTEKLRGRRIIAAAAFAAVTVAFLVLSIRSALVSARPAAPGRSNEAVQMQVPDTRGAEQTRAIQTPMQLEPMELFQTPMQLEPLALVEYHSDDPSADQALPARLEPSPAPNPSPKSSEQPLFKSRRALETLNPRDITWHATAAQ